MAASLVPRSWPVDLRGVNPGVHRDTTRCRMPETQREKTSHLRYSYWKLVMASLMSTPNVFMKARCNTRVSLNIHIQVSKLTPRYRPAPAGRWSSGN